MNFDNSYQLTSEISNKNENCLGRRTVMFLQRRCHSSDHSFKSHASNHLTGSMTTLHPIPVVAGNELTFWTWYDIEDLRDCAVVEVSTDHRKWDDLLFAALPETLYTQHWLIA